MRKACIDCTMKHLGEAALFDMEVTTGYPQFAVYVIGALSHATTEICELSPELAMTIREHRLRWMNNRRYKIPYEELGEYLDVVSTLPEGTEWPAPPSIDGPMSGDTRP